MRIAFQGELGAYSEAAVQEYFSSVANASLVEAVPCESFDAVFAAVQGGFCEYGLIPIENSLAGSIHRNYDLLLLHQLSNDAPIVIVGEYYLRVRHCLISLPGVRIEEIHKVISHPQALAQCEAYLRRLGVAVEAVYDTAGSVKIVKEQDDRTLAAIASRRAADLYQMQILDEGIEDASAEETAAMPSTEAVPATAAVPSTAANFTRFLIIATQPVIPNENAKTSIVFTLHNVPGALFKALSVFALRDIDLTKIESRPLVGKLWHYLFYIDIAGSIAEPAVNHALDNLREYALTLRVLGSYPRHNL